MTGRWVPTGHEYDEGAPSPVQPKRPGRSKRLLNKVLGRSRAVRHELVIRPGVGEARTVTPGVSLQSGTAGNDAPSDVRQARLSDDPMLWGGVPEIQAPDGKSPPPAGAARAPRQTPPPPRTGGVAATPPRARPPRRQTTIRPGVAADLDQMGTYTPPDDGRVGSWELGLDADGQRRKIGPIQNQDDHT